MLPASSAPTAPLTTAAAVFAALGDSTRIGIVVRLSTAGPLSITRLAEGAGVSRQAVTKHLHALASAGLLRDRPRGRERIWELDPEQLDAARSCLEQISLRWDAAIERLRALVEAER